MAIKLSRESISAFSLSLLLHAVVLGSLAFIVQNVNRLDELGEIETVFADDPVEEEFAQQIETTAVPATVDTYQSGGSVAESVGGGGGLIASSISVGDAQSLRDPEISVNLTSVDISGISDIGTDLGSGEVKGEVGAAVEGYGSAISRVTQEVVRHMRASKVLVVWLFDESESMEDDREEIKKQFHKVYEDLGIVEKQDKELRSAAARDKEILQTIVFGYGKELHPLMKAPSSDLKEIRAAIGKIQRDESGLENTCMAVSAVVQKYGPQARHQNRKLLVILVTDESGDDGEELIDSTIDKVKRYEVPVYIMGREAVFGYPYARIRWVDPDYKLDHWLQINRGPETPGPEALQFDGLHHRWDSYASGFGPYEQVRLAKESGGIFLVLPGEEENLAGQEAIDKRKFAFYDMKEYMPSLESRREYVNERKKSRFRETMWDVIVMLNPYLDKDLVIREIHYPFDREKFQKEGQVEADHGIRALKLLNAAAVELEKIKPLRAAEESKRWRANYDLMLGQVYAFRVRLFQAMLALDQHARNPQPAKSKKSNQWNLVRTQTMLAPDPQQVKFFNVDLDELKKQELKARKLLAEVVKNHPQTPWANRAEFELDHGFGFTVEDVYYDPRYRDKKIKLPKP
jgi:hypothetical protein